MTYQIDFAPVAGPSPFLFQVNEALALADRQALVEAVEANSDQPLCGYDAPPCPGGTGR